MKIFMISEEAKPTKIDIIEENAVVGNLSDIPQGNPAYRVKFKARLQTANEPNNNGRFYPTETLEEVYNQLNPKVEEGKLLGELDHPQVMTSDKNGQLKRSSTILLQNACVHFQKLFWDGTHIDCIAQTTTNRAGLDAYAFIKDGVTVGFSLRAFGELEKEGKYYKVPKQGLKVITYDFVAMPSHGNALILELINESTNVQELVRDLKQFEETIYNFAQEKNLSVIEESSIINENNFGQVCTNGFCMLQPIEETIDYLMEQALKNKSFKKLKIKLS